MPQHLLDREGQTVDPLAEVDGTRRHEDPDRPALSDDHDAAARTARMIRVICASSTLLLTRITASPSTISVMPDSPPSSATSCAKNGRDAALSGSTSSPLRSRLRHV